MPTPQRPDPAARLQAAVAERDVTAALRLADQLVHRHGVGALEALLAGPLAALQGREAVDWLRGLVFGEALPAPTRPTGEPRVEGPLAGEAEQGLSPAVLRPSLRLVPLQLRERPVSPAPAPASLAALRAWLPETAELPQAG